ncbi:unnamed protein product [Toxocara canis]|uniref:Uncharacterized protein n=1 Tax=Toxocara canis TaxID=6265 RepID=A0A183UK91_TOXCA|nr:unnamed protein product [Toxocara canis]
MSYKLFCILDETPSETGMALCTPELGLWWYANEQNLCGIQEITAKTGWDGDTISNCEIVGYFFLFIRFFPNFYENSDGGSSVGLVSPLAIVRSTSPPPSANHHNNLSQSTTNQGVRFRKQNLPPHKIASRRSDVRFHSNPAIPVMEAMPDYIVDEMRRSLAVPVSERRKFFETIAEYSHPF